MPIEIRITADPNLIGTVGDQINEAMAALGFVPRGQLDVVRKIAPEDAAAAKDAVEKYAESVKNDAGPEDTENAKLMHPVPRERGKPSFGHARRTKAEIAEDEEAEKLAASQRVAAVKADVLADAAASEAAPEDDAATVEQDEADEAAETAAAVEERPSDKKLTHDDVRNSLGAYVKLYGMAAAQLDGPKVIALALKNPEIVKVSAIPETQEALKAVVAGIEEMTAKNPFGHAKVS